jgi:Lon protease-like protein
VLPWEANLEHAPKQPVPVFPLPDFVLFPGCLAPLHVFELRYRALVRDALRGDRLIALALLKPGWEQDYQGSPAFHPIGCLARLDRVTWQPDDCYDLWATGLARVRFQRVIREYPYRAANVTLAPQEPLSEDDPLTLLERQALSLSYERMPGVKRLTSPTGSSTAPLACIVDDGRNLSFECYVNAVCAELPLEAGEKLALLELDNVLERARRLRERIDLDLGPAKPRTGEESN